MSRLLCKECGSLLMKTPSGACCPNGHGKIQPNVTRGQLKTAERHLWAKQLPTATRIKNKRFELKGVGGLWMPIYFKEGSYRVPTGTPQPNRLDLRLGAIWKKNCSVRLFLQIKTPATDGSKGST